MSAPRTGVLGVGLAKGELYVVDENLRLQRVPAGTTGQVLVADSTTALGLKWLNPTSSVYEPVADASNSFNSFKVRNIANGATATHTFVMPDDFDSMLHVYLAFIPNATQNTRTLNITPTYCAPGEAVTTHAPAVTAFVNNYTGSLMTYIDINSAFAGSPLVASQDVGILIGNADASTMSVVGTVLVYRRKAV